MDAAVAEPISPTVGYPEMSIEERVRAMEGTITNRDRIFDMLHGGSRISEMISRGYAMRRMRASERCVMTWTSGLGR